MSNSDEPRYVVATPGSSQGCPAWCQLTPHRVLPNQVAVGHQHLTGTFTWNGSTITVMAYVTQTLSGTGSDRPIVALTRQDPGQTREQAITADLLPYEATQLAALLGGLDPAALLQFASAIAKAAALHGDQLDDGEAM